MRNELFVLWLLFGAIPSAAAQVSIDINLPGASIGINQPAYPELVAVPGYPVYYAPQVNSNYFFYDGMYWVYHGDNWYASSWYNGPWGIVGPDAVPLFILRIPVRYYREPPAYFHGWSSDAAPRWGEHWGNAWDQRRHGWDTWNRGSVPALAPLPVYQQQYSGNRYPAVAQQQALQSQNYRYQPHEVVVRQTAQAQVRQAAPQARNSAQSAQHGAMQPSSPVQSAAAPNRRQPPQQAGENVQRSAASAPLQQGNATAQAHKRQSKQAVAQAPQQAPKAQAQNKNPSSEPKAAHPTQATQQGVAQHQAQRPPQGVAQHQEQAARPQAPQSKAPVQEPKQGQENGHDKG
jgi:hypothetical protein